jgi:hypothetical protein
MPRSTREFFLSSVVLKIQGQLEKIAARAGEEASNRDESLLRYDSHEPDAAFKHLDAQ